MQKLTRLLSSRLYKVEYELYPETKYRLIEEFPPSAANNNNRYSTHFNTNSSSNINTSTSGGNNINSSNFNNNNSNNIAISNNNNIVAGSGTTGSNSGRVLSGVVGGNPRVKARTRHLSMQGNPRHGGGGSLKRGPSGRPLSACGSEGQLTDMHSQDKQYVESQEQPIPEGSVSTILRNLSSASLSDIANSFKTDRKSTNLASSVVDEAVEEEDEEKEENERHESEPLSKQSIKFGIKKNIMPSTSFSNTPSSSIHSSSNIQPSNTSIGKRSNTNNSGNNSLTGAGGSGTSIGGGGGNTSGTGTSAGAGGIGLGEKSVGRRAISIQQLDTLWQDSGSKLLNFVHHGDIAANSHNSTVKSTSRDDEKRGIIDWDHASGSSIEEMSTKVFFFSRFCTCSCYQLTCYTVKPYIILFGLASRRDPFHDDKSCIGYRKASY